jgi:hypothetical protein
MTAPDESVTVPEIAAEVPCALRRVVPAKIAQVRIAKISGIMG